MNKHYLQLTLEQRYQIWALRDSGKSLRQIAEAIGVNHSTVSRELKRNRTDKGYDPKKADKQSRQRRSKAYKASKCKGELAQTVLIHLRQGLSPGSISARLGLERSDQPENGLSPTSIYRMVAKNKAEGGHWHVYLPNHGRTRWKGGKRKGQAGAHLIPERRDISERPAEVETRETLGHWEGDTVHGQSAHLVTLVERKSLFTLVKRVYSKTKEEVGDALIALFQTVDESLRCTLTLDNGGEFADHRRVSKDVEIDIFFAKPYASWQRGTNENTNGRIRRFWPKKFDMGTLTEEEIERKIWRLNMMPRKILGGLTPFEAFTGKRVALIG